MSAALQAFFETTLRCLLFAYPPAFRARFGGEMLQVYRALARRVAFEAGAGGLFRLWLRALWDGLSGALVQWAQQITKRKGVGMGPNPLENKDGVEPLSPGQALLGALPFLLFGLANIAGELDVFQFPPGRASIWEMLVTHPYFVFNWLILLGLAAGILRGFPRWTFSYLGWAVLDAFWWANTSFYGQVVNWIWLPAFLVVGGALLARRLANPGKELVSGQWRDLTLLPLAVYILYASVYIIFDENHHPALLYFMAGTALAAALGAWAYFRAASPLRRALALIGGLALVVVLSVWSELTWDAAAYYGFAPSSPLRSVLVSGIFLGIMAAIMLAVGGIAEWLNRRKYARTNKI